MKVGIFGDSFACLASNCSRELNQQGRPWMKILEENHQRNVTNFGLSGSSLYYSYQKFKKTYNQFDKIIFVGTSADRKYCPNFKSVQHVTQSLMQPIHKNQLGISNADHEKIINYYMFIHNTQEADDMKKLIVEKIKTIKGNNLLYIDISMLEQISSRERLSDIVGLVRDHRWCHMSNLNNFILAAKINNWLAGNSFDLHVDDFEIPNVEELKSYYELT